jgi:hypothetical protein
MKKRIVRFTGSVAALVTSVLVSATSLGLAEPASFPWR